MRAICGGAVYWQVEFKMSRATLEERIAALEKTVAELLAQSKSTPDGKHWRSAIGMFANDAVMKEIDEEGRRIREEDRRKAQA
ncbi:MAG TPA: hypothetical protein VMY37_38460 [Thermoguttaceae bacterium]|nr:hypothetical protein [Thermoguttaceae bacterium]